MGIKVNVNVDTSRLNAKYGQAKVSNAQKLLSERVGRDSNIHCPVDSGDLRRSMTVAGQDVKWNEPYAKYPYFGGHVLTVKNAQATPAWFETAKSEHLQDWEKVVGDALNE